MFNRSLIAALALVSVTVPAPAQQPGLQDKLNSLLAGTREEQLLPPDQAFRLNVTASGGNKLVAQLQPASGYYLYKDKIRFTLRNADGIAIKSAALPKGEVKVDQTFGKTEVYKDAVPVELTLDRKSQAKNLTLVASYQGCHEKKGVCYPPMEKSVQLTLP